MTVAAVFPGADTVLGRATIAGLVRFPNMAVRSLTPQPHVVDGLGDAFAQNNVHPVLCVPDKRDTVGAAIAGADIVVAILDEAEGEAANVPQLETVIDEALMKNVRLFIWFQPWSSKASSDVTDKIVKKLQGQTQMTWVGLSTGFLMESILEDKIITKTREGFHINVPVILPDKSVIWTRAQTDVRSAIERIIHFWKRDHAAPKTLFDNVHVLASQRASLDDLAAIINSRSGQVAKVVTQRAGPTAHL
ncbi:hypothetical protein OC842_004521 [Tilletia horrida]|uniref:NmrA-like domain-containing protein n=1 Tax=Tilletia horrida TaxID=155126 RepID=A0AAN6JK14_9BASI|nr:hypothetical protein OC842_004521 [Tilletia horrida]